MSTATKRLRMSRFRNGATNAGIIVPMDHGLTVGPLAGITNTGEIARWIRHPAINGVILYKGMAERLAENGLIDGLGLMIHLNGMPAGASDPNRKQMLTSVEAALRLGADAVSVQVNFDGSNDAHNLTMLGTVADAASAYGLPLLVMLYDKVPDAGASASQRIDRLRQLMRICVELGADAIKLAAPASNEDISDILEGFSDLVSVYFAGGELMADDALTTLLARAVSHGGAGLCAGRNVFQRKSPGALLDQLAAAAARTASARPVARLLHAEALQ